MAGKRKVIPVGIKKWQIAVFVLLALLLGTLLGAKQLYFLYRDVSFSWVDHTQAELEVKAYAEEMGISYGEYPQYLIDLYEANPETRDFVFQYPFREEQAVDLSGYSRNTVPLFLQWDPMWGYADYGSSCIAVTGCGPTCLAMVGYYLTGDPNMNPLQLAGFAEKNDYYEAGHGSSWTLISQGGPELGLAVEELPLVEGVMVEALEEGRPIILALGPGDFTTTGHYIVLTGVEEEGFRVNDPNSPIRSDQLWPYETLEGQIRNIWAISTPG